MAVRVRSDGRVLCAAMHPKRRGDTYINDGLHYLLATELRVLVTEQMHLYGGRGGHQAHGEWWWRNAVPDDVEIDVFYLESASGLSNIHESIRRWPIRALQARVRRLEIERDAAFKEAERYLQLYCLDHPEARP